MGVGLGVGLEEEEEQGSYSEFQEGKKKKKKKKKKKEKEKGGGVEKVGLLEGSEDEDEFAQEYLPNNKKNNNHKDVLVGMDLSSSPPSPSSSPSPPSSPRSSPSLCDSLSSFVVEGLKKATTCPWSPSSYIR